MNCPECDEEMNFHIYYNGDIEYYCVNDWQLVIEKPEDRWCDFLSPSSGVNATEDNRREFLS